MIADRFCQQRLQVVYPPRCRTVAVRELPLTPVILFEVKAGHVLLFTAHGHPVARAAGLINERKTKIQERALNRETLTKIGHGEIRLVEAQRYSGTHFCPIVNALASSWYIHVTAPAGIAGLRRRATGSGKRLCPVYLLSTFPYSDQQTGPAFAVCSWLFYFCLLFIKPPCI